MRADKDAAQGEGKASEVFYPEFLNEDVFAVGVVADCGVGTDFCSRIGMGRSIEIRHALRSILTKRSRLPGGHLKLKPK